MDFSELARITYRARSQHDTLSQVQSKISSDVKHLHPEVEYLFYKILNSYPCTYWNEKVRRQSIEKLDEIFKVHSSAIKFDYNILEHFLIGYYTYEQITSIINDLSKINENQLIKNRMYRIPTYISILEGCLANLFRSLVLIINLTTDKDLSFQNKLYPLCEILRANGFEFASDINIDIRNAINHGGVIMLDEGQEILFRYTKGGKIHTCKMSPFEFDRLIDDAYDIASALLLAIGLFLNEHFDLVTVNRSEPNYVTFGLQAMELSIPNIKCASVYDAPNSKQMNIILDIVESDNSFITATAFEVALQVYPIFPGYEQYYIQYHHARMLITFVRFKNEEIRDAINRSREIKDILLDVIHRMDICIPPPLLLKKLICKK